MNLVPYQVSRTLFKSYINHFHELKALETKTACNNSNFWSSISQPYLQQKIRIRKVKVLNIKNCQIIFPKLLKLIFVGTLSVLLANSTNDLIPTPS